MTIKQLGTTEQRSDVYKYGFALGVQQERERVKSILGSDVAKGRRSVAIHLALDTDLDVSTALGILASATAERDATAKPGEAFYDAQIFAIRGSPMPGGKSRFLVDSEAAFNAKVAPLAAGPK